MRILGTIAAFLTAPLWLVTTKRKAPSAKAARKTSREAKRAPAKAKAKRATTTAAKKTAAPRVEPPPPPQEPPPPPPAPPSQAPALFSPPDAASTDTLTPSFRWLYVGGAKHYELVWAADNNLHRGHILLTNQTAATLPPEQALEPDRVYSWRVRAGNEGGWGPWSATRTFRTPEQ